MVLNIKMSGGKCPVVRADGLKWACEQERPPRPPGVVGGGAVRERRLKRSSWSPAAGRVANETQAGMEEDAFHQVPSLCGANP